VITAADALAYCLQTGGTQADCQADVADHMVGGAYCDGDVSIALDASGARVVTCIPTAVIERKLAAMKASPLPAPSSAPSVWPWAVAIGAVVVLAAAAYRAS